MGVLPALELTSWSSTSVYLGSFVITSTLSMGLFAALYGEMTNRLGATADSLELWLKVFSSSLSVIVGLLWLVLSIMGKLDEYFH